MRPAATWRSAAAINILNGGPGAPAFVFVAEHLQGELETPLPGWMGHAEPFAFEPDYKAAGGMLQWLTGTPSIIALAALDAGLDTFDGVAMAEVEAKAQRLTRVVHRRGRGTAAAMKSGSRARATPPGAAATSASRIRRAMR